MKLLCNEQDLNAAGVYKITNTVNGKIYIGSSQCFKERLNKHVRLLKNGKHVNAHLQSAVLKHGLEVFHFEILEVTNLENRFEREQFYMDSLKVCDDTVGYNISPTANGMTVIPQEVRSKISNALKGKFVEEKKALWNRPGYKEWYKAHLQSITKSELQKTTIKENGLKYNKNCMVVKSEVELSTLISDYIDGTNLMALSDKYGHSKSAISRIFQAPTPPLYEELLTKIGFEGNSIKDLRKPEIQAKLHLTQD